MKTIDTKLEGCTIIEPQVFEDSRGCFLETFQLERCKSPLGIELAFVEDNFLSSILTIYLNRDYRSDMQ